MQGSKELAMRRCRWYTIL
uniref:Uncharacterized protein n=1 Tax=Arundo donax TaxID=35708 RepID=A0A0A8YDB5_ARUDO